MDLRNRVVMITGAREGIGAALAKGFAAQGAKLSLIDINGDPPDYHVPNALWNIGDVAGDSFRKSAVARTVRELGPIDVLVNNAAIGLYSTPSRTSPAAADRIFAVNVTAAIALTGLVAPSMEARRTGALVNIESIGSLVSLPWATLYCASKFALHAFTKSLRYELSGRGVQVISVMPGIVNTRFREHVLGGAAPSGVLSIKRAIEPERVAAETVRAVVKKRNTVIVPKIGIAFRAVDLLLPPVMRWYLERCWQRPASERAEARNAGSLGDADLWRESEVMAAPDSHAGIGGFGEAAADPRKISHHAARGNSAIFDIHSTSDKIRPDGTPYSSW